MKHQYVRGDLGGSGSQNSAIDLQMMYSNSVKAEHISPGKGGKAESDQERSFPVGKASSANNEALERMSHVMKELTSKAQAQIHDLTEHNKYLHDYLNQRKSTPVVGQFVANSPTRPTSTSFVTQAPGLANNSPLEVRRSTSFHPISVTTSPPKVPSPSKVIIRSTSRGSFEDAASPREIVQQTPERGSNKGETNLQTSPQTFRFEDRRLGSAQTSKHSEVQQHHLTHSAGQDSYSLALKSVSQQKHNLSSPQKDGSAQISPLRSILKNKESVRPGLQGSAPEEGSLHLRRLRENPESYVQPSDFSFEESHKQQASPGRPSASEYPSGYQFSWAPDSQDSRATARFNAQASHNYGHRSSEQDNENRPLTAEEVESQIQAKSAWLRNRLDTKVAKSQELLDRKLRGSQHSGYRNNPASLFPEDNNWHNNTKLYEISRLQQECDQLQGRLSITLRNLQDIKDEDARSQAKQEEDTLQWNLKVLAERAALGERSSSTDFPSMQASQISTPLLPPKSTRSVMIAPDVDEHTERIRMGGKAHRTQKSVDWSHNAVPPVSDTRTRVGHHRSVSESLAGTGLWSKTDVDYDDDHTADRFYLFEQGATVREDVMDDEDLIRLEMEKLAVESRVRAQKKQRSMLVERLLGCQQLAESINTGTVEFSSEIPNRGNTQHYFARNSSGELVTHKY